MKPNPLWILFLFCLLAISTAVQAQTEQKSLSEIERAYGKDKAAAAQREAEIYREQAEGKKKQAQTYRDMAKEARQYGAQSSDPVVKNRWLLTADKRSKRAIELEKEAQALLKKASGRQQKSKQLKEKIAEDIIRENAEQAVKDAQGAARRAQQQAKKDSTRNENSCQFNDPHELVGLWHYEGDTDSNPMAIVQEYPGSETQGHRLEFHNYKRVWKGKFDTTPDLPVDKPRITFKYKPDPKEMNKDIPAWAREELDGILEWEMEVWAECDDGAVMPHVLFYPGEVYWDDNGKVVDLVGRGKSRRLNLNPNNHLALESWSSAAIGISVDRTVDPFMRPIEALTKHQRFKIVVRLPSDLAKKTGPKITVEIKGLQSGESDEVELTGGRISGTNPVSYSHSKPVTIANRKDAQESPREIQFLSLGHLFGEKEGAKLNLDAQNGETLQFAFDDLVFEVPVYDTFYQNANEKFRKAADRMRAVLTSIMTGKYEVLDGDGNKSEEKAQERRERAHQRLMMIRNFEALIASDKLTDVHRYHLGVLYFGDTSRNDIGLLQLTNEQLERAYQETEQETEAPPAVDPVNPTLKSFLEGMTRKDLSIKSDQAADKVVWMYKAEEQKVRRELRRTSVALRAEALDVLHKDLSFGFYQGITSATGTDMVYLTATGRDPFGRKVPTWQRVQAGIGITSGTILGISGSRIAQKFAARQQPNRISTPRKYSHTWRSSADQAGIVEEGIKAPETPSSLSPAQRRQTEQRSVGAADGPVNEGQSLTSPDATDYRGAWVRTTRALFRHTPENPQAWQTRAHLQKQAQAYLSRVYPDSVKLVEDMSDRVAKQSCLPTCQLKAFTRVLEKLTGNEIAEPDLYFLMEHIIDLELAKNPARLNVLGAGIHSGYPDWVIRKTGRAFGFKVAQVGAADAIDIPAGLAYATKNSQVKLRSLVDPVRKGAAVRAILEFPGNNYHAVVIEGIDVNKRGFVTRVSFFDSNVPGIIDLPAVDFKKLLYKDDNSFGSIMVFVK